jgi:hypothetical protein
MLDWLIIGGGIHGTHLAHVLTSKAGVARDRLSLLDPHPAPLARWTKLTGNTGMNYLRSPAVHNLGLTPDDLDKFASTPAGRAVRSYLHPYYRPGYLLFQAHNEYLVQQYQLATLCLQGTAQRLTARRQGWLVESEQGALEAKRVILAIGRTQLNWPAWALALRAETATKDRIAVSHIFAADYDREQVQTAGQLLVLGGGITAAQVALTLAEQIQRVQGSGSVTLLTRHPLRIAHFDSDPGWNGPRCLTKFHHTHDYAERRAQIRAGRYRGAIPHSIHQALQRQAAAGCLRICEDEVAHAQHMPNGCLQLTLGSGAILPADQILLATGFSQARPGGEWLERAVAAYGLPCAPCGYPIVDRTLSWANGLHVMGPLAELEIGAVSPNIHGARMAAERLATLV